MHSEPVLPSTSPLEVRSGAAVGLGIEPVEFHARRGDALLWTSNIVHGGRPVLDEGRTRWSQVTHYYFEDSVYYTPVFSDFVSGELLLKDVVDLTTLEPVPHRYGGRPVTVLPGTGDRSRVGTTPELHRQHFGRRVS